MRPAVVLDIGSGWSKAGYSGNDKPTFLIPTVTSAKSQDARSAKQLSTDQILIGGEAYNNSAANGVVYPVRNGIVQSWDMLEQFIQQSIFQYLRVDPEEHSFVMTEPPCAPSESRELLAEIMFETFGVEGLFIGAQPVLSLYSTLLSNQQIALGASTSNATSAISGSTPLSAPSPSSASSLRDQEGGILYPPSYNQQHKSQGAASNLTQGGEESAPCFSPAPSTSQLCQQQQQQESAENSRQGSSSQPGTSPDPSTLQHQSSNAHSASQSHHHSSVSLQPEPLLSPYQCTGLVVDVGESSTNVIPVIGGFVVRSAVRSVPLGGRDMTSCVQLALRERGGVPPNLSWEAAKQVKEAHCYVCPNPETEVGKWAVNPSKYGRNHTITDARSGEMITIPIGHERFMSPEVFFDPSQLPPTIAVGNPAAANASPLHVVADQVVQLCPIDTRRSLYQSVVLAGGTSSIRNFGKRMQAEVSALANARVPDTAKAIHVKVSSLPEAGHAAWLGGSLLAGGAAGVEVWDGGLVKRSVYEEMGSGLYREQQYGLALW